MMHKAWCSIEDLTYFFPRSSIKFQNYTRQKNHWFWPKLRVSGLWLQFEFTPGFEMMHKTWCSIEKMPYCFPMSSIKFQGQTGQKIADFDPNWAFPDCNSSLNSPMALKLCTKLDVVEKSCPNIFHKALYSIKGVSYYFSSSYIKFQGHTGWKIDDLDQIWARLLGRSQLSNPSDLPC